MKAIRPINLSEAHEIAAHLIAIGMMQKEDGIDMTSPEHFSEYSYCVDQYMTGCPGYCGKVYIIIWDGSPAAVTTLYRTKDNHLEVGVMSDVDGNAGDGEAARM